MYIFGGQRNKEYATDFITISVDNHEVETICNDRFNSEPKKMPQSGFTQRATIDCERDEIYVLSVSKQHKYLLN